MAIVPPVAMDLGRPDEPAIEETPIPER